MHSSPISPIGRSFVEEYAKFMSTDREALISAIGRYNHNFAAYGNEVYAHLETRVAHWVNFLDQNWFQHRLDAPILHASDFDVVLDLGFSVPYAFTFRSIREQCVTRFVLVDREQSCQVFFDAVTRMNGWQKVAQRSQIVIADLEDSNARQQVTGMIVGLKPKTLLIVASEIMEHLFKAGPVWHWLVNEVGMAASQRTSVYITLPIGLCIPSHSVAFQSPEEAACWINSYLPIHSSYVLTSLDKPRNPFLQACYCAWSELLAAGVNSECRNSESV